MDKNNPLDIEFNLEQAKIVLKNWRLPAPEPKSSNRTWQQIMDERIHYGRG